MGTKTNDLAWPHTAISHSVSKHMRFRQWRQTHTISSKHICSAMAVVSGNTRSMRITGVPWRRGVKRQCGNSKTSIFRVFGNLGQHYYIVLLSPLSLSTGPKIYDLESWPFYLKFSLLRTASFQNLFCILTVEPIFIEYFCCITSLWHQQQKCAEEDRDPQNRPIWDLRKDCRVASSSTISSET